MFKENFFFKKGEFYGDLGLNTEKNLFQTCSKLDQHFSYALVNGGAWPNK